MYNERNYLIFNASEIDKINFDEVLETSSNTLRFSVDGIKTFVKWDNEQPEFVSTLTNTEGPYTYEEMLSILETSEWTSPEPIL